MRYLVFCILTILVLNVSASLRTELEHPEVSHYSLDGISLSSGEVEVLKLLESQLHLSSTESLLVTYKRNSPSGQHITIQHQLEGKPILGSGLKIHLYASGNLIQEFLVTVSDYQVFKEHVGTHYLPVNGNLYLCSKTLNAEWTRPRYEYRYGRELIFHTERSRYYRDTTAKAQVFMPNPILTSGRSYAAPYIDNADADNDSLRAELFEVDIMVRWDNDSFYLEHDSFYFEELSGPYLNDDYKLASDSFFYFRDHKRFEAVNAFYHFSTYISYLDGMGYSGLVQKFRVDVHGLGGADQSEFNPDFLTLQFGDGGVDDAEDAEVLIHEFSHLMSETGSPETLLGTQRKSIEEGLADYIAKSYVRPLSEHMAYDIFTWDGHNQFWDGYILDSDRRYPDDLVNSKDGDRELWSSTLMCIYDYIGKLACDSLVFEYMFYQTPGQTFIKATQTMLMVDSIVFGERYRGYMRECFIARGFMQRPATVDEQELDGIRILNSLGFATGESDLILESNIPFELIVYSIEGQEIAKVNGAKSYRLDPSEFSSGTYVCTIRDARHSLTVKLIKY